ncbi:GIGA6-like protein [Mya arenaria]|uniref:GIGA6-like protein n=1 Tax=Mya arenaria TaxID=6604 RepID=A0ABY7F627_MYAAR|nr:GIGA6-like protein [Mya arenaria]
MLAHAHESKNIVMYSSHDKYYKKPICDTVDTELRFWLARWKISLHTGSTYGYRAMVTLYPDKDFGVFTALTGDDSSYPFRTNMHLFIADLMLGHDPWLNKSTVCTFPEPWESSSNSSSSPPQKDIEPQRDLLLNYGVYSNDAYGNVEIYVNDTGNMLMARYGFADFALYPDTTVDYFNAEGEGRMNHFREYSSVTFKFESEAGQISKLLIPSFQSNDPSIFNLISNSRRKRNLTSNSDEGKIVHRESFDIDEFSRRISAFVESGLRCHDNPGLAISVVRNGETIFSRGFGVKSLTDPGAVTNQTLFGIASLSKAFAATLLLAQIQEDENLSLSTQVRTVLNDTEVFADYLRSHYATLEDLLAHRIGVPSNNNIRFNTNVTRKNLYKRLKYLSPKSGFRTSFTYSNLMYGLVTYISEVIGGKSWEELVTEKLLRPLDMTSTTFMTTADFDDLDLAQGYVDYFGKLSWAELCGSGCIISNANDMAEWMKFHLRGGRNAQSKRVIDTDILEHAHEPQNSISYSSTDKYYKKPILPATLSTPNYGLGWKVGHYRGWKTSLHTGSTFGYRSMTSLFPDQDFGVFTVFTGDDPSYIFRTNLILYTADLLFGVDPWLNASTICTFPEPWKSSSKSSSSPPRKNIKPNRDLDLYCGVYSNEAYGNVEIYKNETENVLMGRYGFAVVALYPKSSADYFYAEGRELIKHVKDFSTFKFQSTSSKITQLIIPSFETKDPPVFKLVPNSRRKRNSLTNSSIKVTFSGVLFIVLLTAALL